MSAGHRDLYRSTSTASWSTTSSRPSRRTPSSSIDKRVHRPARARCSSSTSSPAACFEALFREGLHQAIEAKEGQRIREENQTLATITLPNYFRMYDKLAGMTGTASTEANEFTKIYEADVVSIPTNRDMIRADENDYIFKTKDAKFNAVVEDIVECHERGQPVLVGTISVEISEKLAGMLTRRGVPHNVLTRRTTRARRRSSRTPGSAAR